jgi:hypothetical protein
MHILYNINIRIAPCQQTRKGPITHEVITDDVTTREENITLKLDTQTSAIPTDDDTQAEAVKTSTDRSR